MNNQQAKDIVVAFDTANEIIAVSVGRLDTQTKSITVLASKETPAFRASNTKLIQCIDDLLASASVQKESIACVVCGRGPGSFTGVRICLATAKGLAMGCGATLQGVSTSDAQAWQLWEIGIRGSVVVLGDAMRKEVYPVRYELDDAGIERLNSDVVMKATAAVEWVGSSEQILCGDALYKYAELLSDCGALCDEAYWHPTGFGLLLATQALWRSGEIDPFDVKQGNPALLLPVYTRLSDAEEHERQRFAVNQAPEKDLLSGVQGGAPNTPADFVVRYQPLDAAWAESVANLEARVMGSDAWNTVQVLDDLPRSDRCWWAAYAVEDEFKRSVEFGQGTLIGYVGGWIVDGQLQILKIATDPEYRRLGIAKELINRISLDARDLGATELTLEVRVSNTGAHAFYEDLGLSNIGKRPRYYSDREDAFIFTGPLPVSNRDVAGMHLRINESSAETEALSVATEVPELILAIETSCDETAAAVIDADGTILADIVASQIDFHSRFGGVVPEIASRKHIEAIAGVAEECLAQVRIKLNAPNLTWSDFASISVTYAPGLVGALVVGLAFAKGLAFASGVPLIGVNHLEGHIYANKIDQADITPPMVVSLVSGGHTMLVHVKDWGSYETLGTTLDDAVGEAFDKVAKALGLGYPGGPIISKLAAQGNPKAIKFPRALLHSGDLQFSLSGLKTSVMTYIQKEQQAGRELNQFDIAASFQAAVIDVQVAKARTALEQTGAKEFCLGGGVAANPALRAAYEQMCEQLGVRLTMPPMSACTDNAAMIALVALDRYKQQKFFDFTCDVSAHAPLDEAY